MFDMLLVCFQAQEQQFSSKKRLRIEEHCAESNNEAQFDLSI